MIIVYTESTMNISQNYQIFTKYVIEQAGLQNIL